MIYILQDFCNEKDLAIFSSDCWKLASKSMHLCACSLNILSEESFSDFAVLLSINENFKSENIIWLSTSLMFS